MPFHRKFILFTAALVSSLFCYSLMTILIVAALKGLGANETFSVVVAIFGSPYLAYKWGKWHFGFMKKKELIKYSSQEFEVSSSNVAPKAVEKPINQEISIPVHARQPSSRRLSSLKVEYKLDDVVKILHDAGNKKTYDTKKVKPTFLDHFLYSGKFNSVLGTDGFQIFRDSLKDVVKKVNSDDFGLNYINLDSMFEVLLHSGVYYVEEHLPAELLEIKKDQRWLTAYRYIAKNFPSIEYEDFRIIVKRFKDSEGKSIYILENDSKGLKDVAAHKELFKETIDARDILIHMSQKELKVVCEKLGVAAARSIEDTVDRIIEHSKEASLDHVPDNYKNSKALSIKDTDLATGEDIIHLDAYLRTIAKVVRDDLCEFINKQRHGTLVA